MKIKELAAELRLDSKDVLAKAAAMGIEADSADTEISDINAVAIRNTIKHGSGKKETKVVRSRSKKNSQTSSSEKNSEPKVTVKAAKIKLPEIKKPASRKAAPARSEKASAAQPKGKPIVPKSVTSRPNPAKKEKPVVSKAMLEARIAKEKAQAQEEKTASKDISVNNVENNTAAGDTVKKEQPKIDTAAEKTIPVEKAAPAEMKAPAEKAVATEKTVTSEKTAMPEKTAEAEKKAPEKAAPEKTAPAKETTAEAAAAERKEAQNDKTEKPTEEKPVRRLRSGLKVIKRAEDVRREEAEKKAAAKKRAEARKAEEKKKKESKRNDSKGSERRSKSASSSERPAHRSRRNEQNADNSGTDNRAKFSSHNKKHKEKDRDKEKDRFSRLERGGRKSGKPAPKSLEKQQRHKKHNKPKQVEVQEPEIVLPSGTVLINVPITVAGFAEQTGVSVSKVIMTLLKMGVIANQNQNLDEDVVQLLADEMNIKIAIGAVDEEEEYLEEEGIENFEDKDEDLEPRPPIITVMGHVDHGKTSLLDAIRNTNVTAGESGGITQHIGASEVQINGQRIVFLDTPGHEAFTAMRARGAHVTDIAVLVVAADDSVKPQTVESISHAKAAGVPIIVAINKMDKPGANPDVVKKDLAEHGVLVEDWGGDVLCVPVSAKTGDGIKDLLEAILLQAEVLELKANPNRMALGTVLEARLDKAKGPVASLLILNGTLRSDMSIVAGTCAGKIRLMTNAKGEKIKKAGPATAVEVLGLNDVPQAGDRFNAVKKSSQAKEIAEARKQKVREEVLAKNSSTTLEELFSQIKEGEVKELNLIIKADVQGSVGAIVTSLEKLSNDEVKVNIVHTGVGAINESDVMLAETSGSIIIGFNVRPSITVSNMAERDGIQIRTYNVIYNIIDDVENAMKGMLDPEYKEVVLGTVEIRTTFKVPGVGIVGGAYVTDGKVVRNEQIRLVRDGIVIHEGKISSLKRFKDDVREVTQGYECGIGIENYNDIKDGDIIECFTMEEIARE